MNCDLGEIAMTLVLLTYALDQSCIISSPLICASLKGGMLGGAAPWPTVFGGAQMVGVKNFQGLGKAGSDNIWSLGQKLHMTLLCCVLTSVFIICVSMSLPLTLH